MSAEEREKERERHMQNESQRIVEKKKPIKMDETQKEKAFADN